MQFVEEAVEPARQLPKLIFFVVLQTARQVTFAAGNVLQHARNAEYRASHAARHQPYQQQTDDRRQRTQPQLNQGASGITRLQVGLKHLCRSNQYLFRYIEQDAPGFAARNRQKRRQHFQALMTADALGLTRAVHQFCQLATVVGIDLIQAQAELAGIRAETRQQACRGDDADVGLPVVQLFAGLHTHGLQAVEVDINGKRSDHLAIDHQRENDAGHQHPLPVNVIKVRFDNARF